MFSFYDLFARNNVTVHELAFSHKTLNKNIDWFEKGLKVYKKAAESKFNIWSNHEEFIYWTF